MNCLALAIAAILAAQAPPPPKSEVETLKADLEKKSAHIQDLQRQLDSANTMLNKLEQKKASDVDLIKEFERAAVKAMADAARLQQIEAEKAAKADAEAMKARQTAASPGVVALPTTVTLRTTGVAPGKITATALEIGLVVLSIGGDDNVAQGDDFFVTRDGEVIGRIKIDRTDKKWSAGKITQKIGEIRIGDEVSRHHPKEYLTFTRPSATTLATKTVVLSSASSAELKALRKELDEVRSQVRELSDKIVPAWQGQGVSVDETPEELRAHLSITRGLLVRRVREGSPAEKAGLRVNDVIPDLLETQLLQAIESGMPIHLIRQGQRVRLAGAAGK